MKIVVDDKIPYIKGAFENVAEVVYMPGASISKNDVKEADALIIRTRTRCDKNLLEESSVKFIATATIGFDHIDTSYCHQAGIQWTNAPGCNSGSVEQYFGSLMAHLILNGDINPSEATVGIVGVGNVGKKIERLCRCLGVNVLLNDPPREREEGSDGFVTLDVMAEQADIITFHTPLTMSGVDKTFHLLDEVMLQKLKRKPYIVNSCRGEVTANNVIKTGIKTGQLSGAVLDCWENEPDIDLELLDMVSLATPHIAGYSKDGKANGTTMSVQAVSRFFSLQMDNWQAQGVPAPKEPELDVTKIGRDDDLLVWEILRKTYDINADSQLLKRSPETFENQRGNYPVRREYGSYSILNAETYPNNRTLLSCLGFIVL